MEFQKMETGFASPILPQLLCKTPWLTQGIGHIPAAGRRFHKLEPAKRVRAPCAVMRHSPSPVPLPVDDDEEICFVDECTERYRIPPPEIARLVESNVDPTVTLQPRKKKWLLLLDKPKLPSIAEVAAPELRLAGFRLNAQTYAPSRASYFRDMHFQRTDDPLRKRLPAVGLQEVPLGKSLEIGYVHWSPNGERVAFCIYDPLFGLELWCADVETRRAWCVLPKNRLNAVCGDPFTWCSDSRTLIAKFVIEDRHAPQKSPVPRGPVVQENTSSKPAPGRTYQDLLKDRHDMALFEHYTTCQLARVDVEKGTQVPLGLPAGFRRASPSPDGRYILVDAMVPPYAYMMPAGRFPRRVEVWAMETGDIVATVAEIPMQDKIPIAFDGVGEGPRGIGWRSDANSTLYWAEAQDGGDPSNSAETRDCIFTLRAPFTGAPRKLASLPWRYNGIVWGSDSVALLTERKYKTRSARSYLLAPGPEYDSIEGDPARDPGSEAQGPCCMRACSLAQGEAPKRMILNVENWEDRYNDPGSVYTQRNAAGKLVLRLVYPESRQEHATGDGKPNGNPRVGQPYFLMHGAGASDEGDRPFVSLFDTVTGDSVPLWQSTPPKYEGVITVMSEDEDTNMPKSFLIIQESPSENPNFYVLDIDLSLASSKGLQALMQEPGHNFVKQPLRALTVFPHPAPELANVRREIVHYERSDGVRVNGTLYLPAGYNPVHDGPLPTFIWAYPREYKSAVYAGQVRGSPYRFVRLARTPLYWLARGYAIFDGPGMPIIGEGDTEANDSYVEQLVMSAEAAVDYVISQGVAQRDKIAIGGHSYGAFMTVNLLAHAPDLFCCGIARSGAYNRTLTPFGFQSEERTLWQAPEIYTKMSPYMYAHKIKKPLLLIHGDADNNPGTFPMQSERLYQALKGHGRLARFVSLPHEGHGYRAKESVLHTLAEMTEWLDRFCGNFDGEERLYINDYKIKVGVDN